MSINRNENLYDASSIGKYSFFRIGFTTGMKSSIKNTGYFSGSLGMIASCAWLADIAANICKDEDWGNDAFSTSRDAFNLFSWPGKLIGIFLGFVPSVINGAVNAATRHTSTASGENIAKGIEQLNAMSDAKVNEVCNGIVKDYKEKRSWKQSDSSKKLIEALEDQYNSKQDKINLISHYLKTASQNVGKTLYNIIIDKICGAPSTVVLQKSTLKNKL